MTINERVSPKRPLFAEVHHVPDDYRFTTEELDRIISGDMFTPRQDAIMARELQQYRAAAEKPIGSFHIVDQQVGGTTDYVKDGECPIDNGELLVYAVPQVTSMPEIGEIRVGRLPTMNQEEYPGLGDWWVQLRIGRNSDEVLARVYGATPQEANTRAEVLANRAAMLTAAPAVQAEQEVKK